MRIFDEASSKLVECVSHSQQEIAMLACRRAGCGGWEWGRKIITLFKVALTESDWDKRLGGWKCDALSIPGAQLVEFYCGGKDVSARDYRADGNSILWSHPVRPEEALATISLEKDLAQMEQDQSHSENENLRLEEEKVILEKEKFRYERRWKVYSAVGAVLSALLTAVTTTHFIPEISTLVRPASKPLQTRTAVDGDGTKPTDPASNQSPLPTRIGLLAHFGQSNDFLSSGQVNHYEALLRGTRREVWFVGTSFYISVDTFRDELVAKLKVRCDAAFSDP